MDSIIQYFIGVIEPDENGKIPFELHMVYDRVPNAMGGAIVDILALVTTMLS